MANESGRSEQIVFQFLLKSLHIILDSRIPSLRPTGDLTSRVKKSDKWFHLALGDRPAALENLNFWHRNVMDPMIIDIILVREDEASSSNHLYTPSKVETVIERWTVQFENENANAVISQSSEGHAGYKRTYKKSIILLRSLYSTMRLLPAYKIFQQLSSSTRTYDFDIIYKVSTFSEPFSREEEAAMRRYSFVPVDAQPGRLSISLMYYQRLSHLDLELSTSLPPQIITDYVGSPATDPLKVFTSTEKGICATSFPSRGLDYPSSTPFQRPHSWTSGLHKGAPFGRRHSLSGSPPVYPAVPTIDYSHSPPDIYGYRVQGNRISNHTKGMSFDEHQFSPPFSPSPSPSPPTYFSTGNSSQTRFRSESAPVNIPLPLVGRNTRYLTPSSSDPYRHSLPPMSPRSTKLEFPSQESPSGNRSFRKTDAQRAGELYTGISNMNLYSGQKVSRDNKDDSGRFSGLVSSSDSPRIGFSRSSSRLSFQDDLDDCEFCPFAVDDVDTSDSQSRTLDGKEGWTSQAFSSTRKSQDAEIGVLVHMLQKAPPLRQDYSCYSPQSSKTEFDGELGATSGFFMPRKTADALEELRSFKEMKDLLLSQSGTHVVSKDHRNPAASVG